MSSSSAVKIPSSFIEALIKLTVEPSGTFSFSEEIKLSTIVICDGFFLAKIKQDCFLQILLLQSQEF